MKPRRTGTRRRPENALPPGSRRDEPIKRYRERLSNKGRVGKVETLTRCRVEYFREPLAYRQITGSRSNLRSICISIRIHPLIRVTRLLPRERIGTIRRENFFPAKVNILLIQGRTTRRIELSHVTERQARVLAPYTPRARVSTHVKQKEEAKDTGTAVRVTTQ